MTHLLETIDLVTNFYTYEGVVKALNKVSIVLNHGSTFGLVGESGCGKSVFARSIMRIVQEPGQIESGKILLFPDENQRKEAMDLLQQSEAYMQDLRGDQISMIFQEPNAALDPIMSIGEQVAESFLFHRTKELCGEILATLDSGKSKIVFPIKACLKTLYRIAAENPDAWTLRLLNRIPLFKHWNWLLKKEAIKQSIGIMAQLGIPDPETLVKQYPHNLSGGMKQRIVIAIALACQPILLIADEATSNLDVTIQAQILELLKELKKKEISSVLLITHDLGVVAETCDRVGVMYAGNLCEVADVKEIFRNPLHPYTKALLDSVPKLSFEGELKSIEGNVPNLLTPPSGCRFHPRCEHVMDICKKTSPSLVELKQGHQVACHLFSRRDN